MRQVGVLAACGIVALDTMIERLDEDHENAKKLAIGLAEINKIEINPDNIHTNLVRFKVPENTGFEVTEKLKDLGILINGSYTDLRMVPHYGINSKDIDSTIHLMSKVMNSI
jgi:threonine aldolase